MGQQVLGGGVRGVLEEGFQGRLKTRAATWDRASVRTVEADMLIFPDAEGSSKSFKVPQTPPVSAG